MKQSKLIQYLQTFSGSEMKKLRKLINSPYFNTDQSVMDLFYYLEKGHPTFSGKKMVKEVILKKLFKEDIRKFTRTQHKLFKLIETYIILERLDAKPHLKDTLYAEGIYDRDLEKHMMGYISKSIKQTEKIEFKQTNHHLQLFHQYNLTYSEKANINFNKGVNDLQKALEHLDFFYIINKLFFGQEIINRQDIINEEWSIHLFEEVIQQAQQPPFKDNLIIKIYVTMVQMIRESNKDLRINLYYQLKQQFYTNLQLLSRRDQIHICIILLNYSYRLSDRNNELQMEPLAIYKLMFDHHIISKSQDTYWVLFLNAIQFSSSMGNFDWAEELNSKFVSQLTESIRANVTALTTAIIAYYKNDFDQTLILLNDVQFKNFFFSLSAKILILKTYYETENYFVFDNFSHSFKAFIRRHQQMSEIIKTRNLNFVRFVEKLVKEKLNPKKDQETLMKELKDTEPIIYRNWLVKKIRELK